MNTALLLKYAELVVKIGVNLQKNQTLVLTSPVECAYFARMVAEAAYREGAREVVMKWEDELSDKIRYLGAAEEVFEEFPKWRQEFYSHYLHKGAAFLGIYAFDPDLMRDVNPARISKYNKTVAIGTAEYRDLTSSYRNAWSVISIPTKAWAKKVLPELDEDSAVERLWEAITVCVRLDSEDPVMAWEDHKNSLKRYVDFLNKTKFKLLRYKNSLGTDLTIELPKKHIWSGASEITYDGIEILPNMPTEEIFTMPMKTGVNGKVVGSRPIVRNGNIIDDFYMSFKDGRVIDYNAGTGFEILKGLIETDDGSCCLGEVALVPYNSAVSKTNLLYWNMLFDENASCHLALGNAYPTCLEKGADMTREELLSEGANVSMVHQDFMMGTKDLEITGVKEDGQEVPLMKDGNFVF